MSVWRWSPCALCLIVLAVGCRPADPPKPKVDPPKAEAGPPKAKDGPLGMKFVPLPKGTTYLGWNGQKGSAKKTEIKEDFEIAVYTVTQGQWQELMGKNPSWYSRDGKGKEMVKDIKDEELKQFPVECVSWVDCQEFIKKLNEMEKGKGYMYRLPTEEEWEYACRGGATTEEECSYHYYFDKPTNDLSSEQANLSPLGRRLKGPYLGRTTKVGSYAPNKLGLYDMHGNVSQWTDSLWTGRIPEKSDPFRVHRGGGFGGQSDSEAAERRWLEQSSWGGSEQGVRLVRVPVR